MFDTRKRFQANRRRLSLAAGVAVIAALGCGESASPEQPVAPSDASHLYWALTLAHHAITLSTVAPFDTIRLLATPQNAEGAPLTGLGPVSFRSIDAGGHAQVDSTGLVTAMKPATQVMVIATLTDGNETHADTAVINITADSAPAPLAHFSIHPVSPDSTTIAMGLLSSELELPIQATDAAGNPLQGISVAATSSNTSIATLCGVHVTRVVFELTDAIQVCANRQGRGRAGRAAIIATTTSYGVTLADTVEVTVTMPLLALIVIQPQPHTLGGPFVPSYVPSSVTVVPGATVLWLNAPAFGSTGRPIDVTFDDTTNVESADTTHFNCRLFGIPTDSGGSGNIAAFGDTTLSAASCRSRRFPVAGVYGYHSTITGATGKIVVTTGLSSP